MERYTAISGLSPIHVQQLQNNGTSEAKPPLRLEKPSSQFLYALWVLVNSLLKKDLKVCG